MTLPEMTLAGSVLILAVALLRAAALHRLPKVTFLLLWGVVLVRLLVPFSLPSPTSIYNLAPREAAPPAAEETVPPAAPTHISAPAPGAAEPARPMAPAATHLPATAPVPAAPIRPAAVLSILWLAGLAGCALFFLVAYLRCLRRFRASLPLEDPFAAQWLRDHPLRRRVELRVLDAVAAPLTYGLVRPVILLPRSMDLTDRTALGYVLAHEYTHIRRWDGLWKLLLTAAVCVHWFNPLVWLMYTLANRDLELTCDAAVLRRSGPEDRAAYARTLLTLEEARSGLRPLANHFSRSAIEGRIRAIMVPRRVTAGAALLAGVLAVALTACFATSPLPPAEADRPREGLVQALAHPSPTPRGSAPDQTAAPAEAGSGHLAPPSCGLPAELSDQLSRLRAGLSREDRATLAPFDPVLAGDLPLPVGRPAGPGETWSPEETTLARWCLEEGGAPALLNALYLCDLDGDGEPEPILRFAGRTLILRRQGEGFLGVELAAYDMSELYSTGVYTGGFQLGPDAQIYRTYCRLTFPAEGPQAVTLARSGPETGFRLGDRAVTRAEYETWETANATGPLWRLVVVVGDPQEGGAGQAWVYPSDAVPAPGA